MLPTVQRRLLSAFIGVVVCSQTAAAQPRDTASVAKPVCWRARPLPRCASIVITELGYSVPLTTTRTDPDPVYSDYPDFPGTFRSSVGFLQNVSTGRAHGLVLALTSNTNGAHSPAIEWRTRFWQRGTRGFVDLSTGYTQADVFVRPVVAQRGSMVTAHGITAAAAIAPIDLIGISVRDNVVFTRGRVHHGLTIGAQTGSYGSVIVIASVALYVGIIIIAFMTGGGDF